MTRVDPIELIFSLVGYPGETEWIEFKESANDPDRIGKDISALANSATAKDREFAYKIWGVTDKEHELVGTTFDPLSAKAKGNQDLQIWLSSMLSPNANYEFLSAEHEGMRFVILRICAAVGQPVRFSNVAYIRTGSSTTPLKSGTREAALWRKLQGSDFESQLALEGIPGGEVPELLNTDAYFELNGLPRPSSLDEVIEELTEQGILKPRDDGRVSITNLGALLLARRLSRFPGLRKRVLRIVRFAGNGNTEIIDNRTLDEGYSTALQKAEEYIMIATPAEEEVDGAFRSVRHAYPQRAVRELLSNAVIHQDLTDATSGPSVWIYGNRIEFSNPGASLIPMKRILNAQPRTRNNLLVGQLRLMGLCEEGGTGWDLVVESCESLHMYSPLIESDDETGTRVTLLRGGAWPRMTKQERVDALYWHACLKYAQRDAMNNQSLRERFGLSGESKNSLAMSRLIKEACGCGLIKPEDENAGTKFKRYVPSWA